MTKKTKMVLIGNQLIGLIGLDEIFNELYKSNPANPNSDHKLEKEIGKKLVTLARKDNYIPSKQEEIYASALLREYYLYYQKKLNGSKEETSDSCCTYRGIPRETIPWYPTVYEEKCDGCKKCYDMCPQKVYFWDKKTNKPKVVNPFACVVGCSVCAEICKLKAISFPPISIMDNLKSH
jgi:NAD-dependent dihydropyrimidine dehydrogenase PreA subunit